MQVPIHQGSVRTNIPFMIKPYSDTYFNIGEESPEFDDIEYLWKEIDNNKIDKKEVANMASFLLDSFISMNLNPHFGYYPVIFINDYGIHPGIFLDLDINYIRKNDSSVLFFLPEQVLSSILQ
jgi:hypothetical protein